MDKILKFFTGTVDESDKPEYEVSDWAFYSVAFVQLIVLVLIIYIHMVD